MTRKGILGRKVGMTQVFTENGELVPVTVVDVTPNVVLQTKSTETDGYNAIQLGYEDKRDVLSNKPEKGHVAKANTNPKRFIKEIRDVELSDYNVADEIKADIFEAGDIVDVYINFYIYFEVSKINSLIIILTLYIKLRIKHFFHSYYWLWMKLWKNNL